MAEDEIKLTSIAKKLFLNGQIEHAKAKLIHGLKLHPESVALQDMLQQYQNIKVLNIPSIQQENEEVKQSKVQDKVKIDQITNNYKIEQEVINEITKENKNDAAIEHTLRQIANNTFQMRLKVLSMEIKVVDTYYVKNLIENENDKLKKTHDIKMCMYTVFTALDSNNFEMAENELLIAESLSTELMKRIKTVFKRKTAKKDEVKIPEDDIEVPDYRSIVTVRGTKEDVTNCILKAKRALENGKYDRAESLLLKAERIFPTKNARDLLKQVQAAREPKQNSDSIEIASEAIEQVNTVQEEEIKSECDSVSAAKCMTAFEKAFSTGNFEKAKRMLNKAKRFDPSLDVEQKLSQVKAAINKKIMEEKRKEETEKAKREIKTAGECFYKSIKAYGAGDFVNAEQILVRAKLFDPRLNLEPELLTIRNKMASKSNEEYKYTDKTEIEKTVTENSIKLAAEYLYKAKKAHDAGNFKNAERNLNAAKACDSSLDLEWLLSKCRAEVASRSSTEGNKVIPEDDTVTKYSKENTELCKHNVEQAEIAYKNKNINETSMFLKSAKSYYPCTEIDNMIEHVEACNKNKRGNPSHEITTSETEFSCFEKQKEIEMQIERRVKEVVEKEKSKMKKRELVINNTSEDQENNLDNENDKMDVRLKKHADNYKSDKDTKQSLNRIKLQEVDKLVKKARHFINTDELENAKVVLQEAVSIHATSIVKSLMEQVEKDLKIPKRSNHSSEYKAYIKTTKPRPKEEQVKSLICAAEKEIHDKKFQEALNILTTAEELCPTEHAKELIKNVNEIICSCEETSVLLNCYEFPVQVNESDTAEALKCIEMAQGAFQALQYDRAEHLLKKSLRICYSRKVVSYLDIVHNAKVQNNTKVNSETSYNEHVKDHSLNENNSEYNKCIDIGENAIAEGDLTKAERFLSKAIRINPNDDARRQLENIENIRSSQPLNDEATTSKIVKCDVDLEQDRVAEMFIDLSREATSRKLLNIARMYLEYALQKQPSEKTRELLRDVQSQIDCRKGRHSQLQHDKKSEANKLLDKADNLIRDGNLERAELWLIMSWEMDRGRRVTSVHKKLLEARLLRFEKNYKQKHDRQNCGICKNIFESDKLVKLVLDKYEENTFEEARDLLMRAAEFCPSYRIDKLLFEIREIKNNGDGTLKKIFNFVKNIF